MYKLAGWIISDTAVDAWRAAHPQVKHRQMEWSTKSKIMEIVNQRHDVKFPFKEHHIVRVRWPKMTPEHRGERVCILIRRLDRDVEDETWKKYTPFPKDLPEDDEVAEWLKSDGLELGEWVTVPDPFESDWPFARRYPGKRCPPDPSADDPVVKLW